MSILRSHDETGLFRTIMKEPVDAVDLTFMLLMNEVERLLSLKDRSRRAFLDSLFACEKNRYKTWRIQMLCAIIERER